MVPSEGKGDQSRYPGDPSLNLLSHSVSSLLAPCLCFSGFIQPQSLESCSRVRLRNILWFSLTSRLTKVTWKCGSGQHATPNFSSHGSTNRRIGSLEFLKSQSGRSGFHGTCGLPGAISIDDFGRSVKTIACPFDLTAAALTPHRARKSRCLEVTASSCHRIVQSLSARYTIRYKLSNISRHRIKAF